VPEPNSAVDLTLIRRIVARDQDAVAELYDRHGRLVYSLALRILRSPSDAEEVVQEVFVRVWSRADSYDERLGTPAAWLARIARNRAIDRFRSRRARGGLEPVAGDPAREAETAVASSVDDNPELLIAGQSTAGAVRGALARLPEAQRRLIEAAFFEGYTHQELADRFGVPLGTVKTRIRTGLTVLRGRLEHLV
jgi:RNA polymerase sigma-70 factor (ECF subfamily)